MCDLSAPHFHDPDKAREHLEKARWPNGPVCPHCGNEGGWPIKTRPGIYKCSRYKCRRQFTVTVGTVFERSKIPLNKWLMAVHLMCSSKKGISAHQLHRNLGVTYKSAWFMAHRIREAMKDDGGLLGGNGPVEVDETFYGVEKRHKRKKRIKAAHKMKIFTLVERGGRTRTFHVKNVRAKTLRKILRENLEKGAVVYTDSAGQYRRLHEDFPTHQKVNHLIGEYARGDVHTNTVEGYFAMLKRGIKGTFHHVSEKHLNRYCREFDFRHSYRTSLGFSDADRADIALRAIGGKRLMYGGPCKI